jgi:hypothetical protein
MFARRLVLLRGLFESLMLVSAACCVMGVAMRIASAFQCPYRWAEQQHTRAVSAPELLSSIFALVSPYVKHENTENMGQNKHFGDSQN